MRVSRERGRAMKLVILLMLKKVDTLFYAFFYKT